MIQRRDSQVLRGIALPSQGHAPTRIEEQRFCYCGNRLSMYNKHETCWVHSEGRYLFRVRGKKVIDD